RPSLPYATLFRSVAQLDIRLRVTYLPPPLMAGDLDLQHLLSGHRQGQHAVADGYAEDQQQRHAGNGQDQAAADDPAILDTARPGRIQLAGPAGEGIKPEGRH